MMTSEFERAMFREWAGVAVARGADDEEAGKRKEIAESIISGRKSSAENGTSLQHRLANPTKMIDSATVSWSHGRCYFSTDPRDARHWKSSQNS